MIIVSKNGYDIVEIKTPDGKKVYGVKEHMRKGILFTFEKLKKAVHFVDKLTSDDIFPF